MYFSFWIFCAVSIFTDRFKFQFYYTVYNIIWVLIIYSICFTNQTQEI